MEINDILGANNHSIEKIFYHIYGCKYKNQHSFNIKIKSISDFRNVLRSLGFKFKTHINGYESSYSVKNFFENDYSLCYFNSVNYQIFLSFYKLSTEKNGSFILKCDSYYNNVQESLNLYKQIYKKYYYFKRSENNDDSCQVGMLSINNNNLNVNKFDIKIPKINLEECYNDSLLSINDLINDGIRDENKANLVLLRSEPGCGKTTYIKNLIRENKDVSFIYLPPNLTSMLTEPSFINFVVDNMRNSVLIIEDSENIIKKRMNDSNNSPISTLLNMTDGLLKNILNIKIICTANCDLNNIDEALLRKGRLLALHEFDKLTLEKTNHLLKKINPEYKSDECLKLSDIFNFLGENFNNKNDKKIGFNN